MPETSASLLERLRGTTDQAAWARFVGLYTPLLYFWGRRAGLQETDAADLVQEVLVLLMRKLPEFSYNPGQSFRAWLRTVALNKYREQRRRRHPEQLANGDDLAEQPAGDAMAAFEETAYRQALVSRTLPTLEAEFPPQQWAAFREYVLHGRDPNEVAAELNIRPGTVYAAKSRILSRLRQELAGLLD